MHNKQIGKILIVTTDLAVRESLKRILENVFGLIWTESVSQAFNCLENDKTIQLVFLDARDDAQVALEALSVLKIKDPHLKLISIVENKTIGAGDAQTPLAPVDACVSKPFKSNEIVRLVDSFLGCPP